VHRDPRITVPYNQQHPETVPVEFCRSPTESDACNLPVDQSLQSVAPLHLSTLNVKGAGQAVINTSKHLCDAHCSVTVFLQSDLGNGRVKDRVSANNNFQGPISNNSRGQHHAKGKYNCSRAQVQIYCWWHSISRGDNVGLQYFCTCPARPGCEHSRRSDAASEKCWSSTAMTTGATKQMSRNSQWDCECKQLEMYMYHTKRCLTPSFKSWTVHYIFWSEVHDFTE
jgi:hypothetical protein